MVSTKEGTSLLPISASVKNVRVIREGKSSLNRVFCWLHALTLAVLVCWLSVLTLQSWRPGAKAVLPEEVIRQLMTSQEVRDPELINQTTNFHFQIRGRRQLTTLEGDIMVRNSNTGEPTALDAHLADPNRLWPSGVVEYKFYDTFPAANKEIVLRGMRYISSKASCITFREATESTIDFVLIRDGLQCNSELGRTGGQQLLNLNRWII